MNKNNYWRWEKSREGRSGIYYQFEAQIPKITNPLEVRIECFLILSPRGTYITRFNNLTSPPRFYAVSSLHANKFRRYVCHTFLFLFSSTFFRWKSFHTHKKRLEIFFKFKLWRQIQLLFYCVVKAWEGRFPRAKRLPVQQCMYHYGQSKHNCVGINCLFMLGMGLQTNFLDVWPCCMYHWRFALAHAVC